jgi:DNA helicase II / ATP-dependent DNA helicase PcrA
MDAFQIARRRAQGLRAQAGEGFKTAHDLVSYVLRAHFGFGIAPTQRHGTLLRGDEARVHRDFSQVLVRDDVDQATQSVLLAHELGHIALHAPAVADESDAQSPVLDARTISRTDIYGPRERRELQANVFAREFLLPRDVARRLFLDERLSAGDIAKRLDLPLAFVRRQLADVLLRPESAKGPSKPDSKIDLDQSQQDAVGSKARATLVEAGPGAGKTRTLISRIERRLAEGVPPRQILVLTFSNKAAAECADRLTARLGAKAAEVWIGTFHSFGLELIRLFYAQLGLPANVRLLMPAQAIEMLEDQLPLLNLTHHHDLRRPGEKLQALLSPIMRAKDELVLPDAFAAMAGKDLLSARGALANDTSTTKKHRDVVEKAVIAAEKTCEAATVYAVYDRLMRDKGLIDLSDLIMRPTLLLEKDDAARAQLQNRFSDVLVDEYQDVNRGCARLLQTLHGPGNTIWAVGDSRQAIYRFRGASARNMRSFAVDFEEATSISLTWNYRSSSEIVGQARQFAERMDQRQLERDPASPGRTTYAASAQRGACGTPTTLSVGLDDACEADLLADEIRALEAAGVPLRDQTVLARTNRRLDELAPALLRRGIAVAHLGSFFEREAVRDVLSIIALVCEPNGGALVRIAAQRGIAIGQAAVRRVIDEAHSRGVALMVLLREAESIEGIDPAAAKALRRLGVQLAGMDARMSAFDVALAWLVERSDSIRHLIEATGLDGELDRSAVRHLLTFLDQTEYDGSPLAAADALKRVRTVIALSDDRDLREPELGPDVDAVRLLTVHKSKGLEFRAVHIVGLHQGGFPMQVQSRGCSPPSGIDDGEPSNAHVEEEDNIMFVALSRAEEHLRLYHTQKAIVRARQPSRFLADLDIEPSRQLDAPSVTGPAADDVADPIKIDRLTLYDLRDFDLCPLKVRYRRGMAIRSRRHESPFLQTSGVLYALLDQSGDFAATSDSTLVAATAIFENVWTARGPTNSSLAPDYRRLAEKGFERLTSLVRGFRPPPSRTVAIAIDGGHVEVQAPILRPEPMMGARYIVLKSPLLKIEQSLLYAGAQQIMAAKGPIEIVTLDDGAITLLAKTEEELAADLGQAATILSTIRSGSLKAKPVLRVCVRCAQFFACPSMGYQPPAT